MKRVVDSSFLYHVIILDLPPPAYVNPSTILFATSKALIATSMGSSDAKFVSP
ncbi:MAG: hypothetical protein QW335_08095 [Candidatus Nezhaarchaeales archaeon]